MRILEYLQRVGRALMVPVATLPAAAILMGIGYWIDPVAWGGNSAVAAFLIKSGSAILDSMPVLFAIGVAYGMSRDKDGAAALAGFVGYQVLVTLLSPAAVAQIERLPLDRVSPAFGKIENQFIGILSGLVAAELYNRYSAVEMPKALAFFSGRRLVPILTSAAAIPLAFLLMYAWPPVYMGLVHFGESIHGLGAVGAGLYGFLNRLLIPVGLHHALNSVFWFDVAGINDIPTFLAGAQSLESGKATLGVTGRYQAGFFPIMMFGLPGAALAIYHTARPQNRARVASLMMAAGFATFFTGVTEPLEFSFMFVAPLLYALHAVLTGVSLFVAASMQWIAGFGFSAGLIDLVLSSRNPLAVRWYMLLLQGLVFFGLYYVVFRAAILKFDLKTPGRLDEEPAPATTAPQEAPVLAEGALRPRQYLKALGGHANLASIDACITRLRLTVRDHSKVDERALKALGAAGVIKVGTEGLQVVLGPLAETVAAEMKTVPADEDLGRIPLP